MSVTRTELSNWNLRPWSLVFLALALLPCLSSAVRAASVSVTLPDRSTTLSIVRVSGRPYVDAQALVGLVSGELRADPRRGRASLLVSLHTLTVQLGSPRVLIDRRAVHLSSPPVLQSRRFLLPLDILPVVLAGRYGQQAVEWEPAQRVARIRSREATIARIRVGSYPSHTRVVLETIAPLEWSIQQEEAGSGLQVLVPGGVLAPGILPLTLRAGIVRVVQPAQHDGGVEVRLLCEGRHAGIRSFALRDPDRIVIDVLASGSAEVRKAPAREGRDAPPPAIPASAASRWPSGSDALPVARPAQSPAESPELTNRPINDSASPPSSGELDAARVVPPVGNENGGAPTRVPGALTVVLDAGHGGHDTGAVGPSGLLEKDVVLDLALRLRRLLRDRLGVRVIMTRTEDIFIPLQERTAIANRAKADFFVSLHMNGAAKRGAVGFETFYFTREPSDNDARASAQRENLIIETDAARGKDQESLLRITLADMAVTRDMRESGELAELVLTSLDKLLKVENRGVKSGPFYVLATAAMPAILVEGAFITNPKEERRLQQEAYRERVATALFEGIAKYKARYERRVGMRGGAPAADS
jgi:N-acetylmuramoyl-L-alanine amidase